MRSDASSPVDICSMALVDKTAAVIPTASSCWIPKTEFRAVTSTRCRYSGLCTSTSHEYVNTETVLKGSK